MKELATCTIQFQRGLPPVRVATQENGLRERTCHFRERGLAIAEVELLNTERPGYVIAHEQSGGCLSPVTDSISEVLAWTAALLHVVAIDWTQDIESMCAQVKTLPPMRQAMVVAVARGEVPVIFVTPEPRRKEGLH